MGYGPKSLDDMMHEVREVNTANGWHDSARTFGDGIALLHSELSEALEAFRDHGLHDATAPTSGHLSTCPMDPLTGQGACDCPALPKPEGVGSEFADVLIRLLDECDRGGIDLEAEYRRKIAYNRTRGYRHGGRAL